jgi:CubicO group peptidase (beta-lactamase class C family)
MPDLPRVGALALLVLVGCAAAPVPPAIPASSIKTAAVVATPPVRTPTPAPPIDPQADLATEIDTIFARFGRPGATLPGCEVGVYRAGAIVFSKGYGYADVEHDAPITETTPFYSASLSKQFTAAAVLLLVADGKISLDDDVRKYIPELPDFGKRITLDHLLHHTSGLRDYHLLLLLEGLNEEDVITRREILWLLSHQRSLGFAPGSRFSYSSSGYVLLAEIVARVAGESFGSFLAKRVLEPLGMTGSLVREDHARPIPRRAIGYTLGSDGEIRSWMGNLEYDGSSNLVTTTRDLAKWDANFYDPKVGGQALIDAMRMRGKLTDGTVLEYAMGLQEWETHGLHVEEHNGAFAGYRTIITRYPSERLTVSVLCNTTEADADDLAAKVAAVFLPQLSAPEPKTVAQAASRTPAPFGFDLAMLAGTYVDRSTAELRAIDASGGVLHMRYPNTTRPERELVPVGPGDLVVAGGQTHYAYEPAVGKRPAQLVRTTKVGLPQTFARAEPVAQRQKLAEYAGRYGSDELAHDVEIRVEDGRLVVAAVGGAARRPPLAPVARDFFAVDDIGWTFERDPRGKVVRLVASTDRAREVVLVRR